MMAMDQVRVVAAVNQVYSGQADDQPCTACGACCAYSYDWPEFEEEDALDGIPEDLCDCDNGRMRCDGDRCVALVGTVGVAVRCTVYESRPGVCRRFEPRTEICNQVRRFMSLPGVVRVNDAAGHEGR